MLSALALRGHAALKSIFSRNRFSGFEIKYSMTAKNFKALNIFRDVCVSETQNSFKVIFKS